MLVLWKKDAVVASTCRIVTTLLVQYQSIDISLMCFVKKVVDLITQFPPPMRDAQIRQSYDRETYRSLRRSYVLNAKMRIILW